ncbi:helix-turn-helix domain-containing protein [Levilactobacillus brevis]|uniref:helix-turn-helix domain-containing protein n=1 Tax=Levilactobacillus brevis TaxID=1580 RepID=UPI00057CFDE9|nr:helix-turn-helix transcriptional regulator [Levilactobacillus brevis]KID42865.1 prophage Lp1 protein 8 [Levilactobacillus brevis]STX20421.1 prophage P2a protein 9, phage Cro/CI family transcriptional regulator [Levilactobacillus brevis]
MADKKLAQRIIDLRESADMKQAELGRRLGLDRSAMSKIENGTRKVSSDELAKLSEIFSVTTDYLLGKNSTPVWANEKDTNDLEKFLTDNEGSMTYGGEDLTEEEKEQVRVAMTTIFWKRHKHD